MNDIRYVVMFCNRSSFQHGPEYRNQRQNDFVFQDLITVHKDTMAVLGSLRFRHFLVFLVNFLYLKKWPT